MNLTTKARYKAYAGITGTGQDALITALIPQVSDQISLYLRRDLTVTTYYSWLDGLGGQVLRLPQWPLLAMYQVSVTSAVVGYITNTSSSVQRASVSFDGTNLSLNEVSTAGAVTTTDKAVATSKILSTLETAVEAVSGWTMVLNSTDYNAEPSAWLRPILAAPALDPDTADLVLPDEVEAVKAITEDTIEIFDGGDFPSGAANIFVWYKAGYTLPTDDGGAGTMPPGLELLTFQILTDVLSSTKMNSNLQSESIGGYSYSLSAQEKGSVLSAVQNRKRDLNLYRKVTV